MRRILQFVPTLMPGDATGMHALMIEESLRTKGVETKIYVEEVKENQIGDAVRFTHYSKENRSDDILIYHLAAPSAIADFLSSRNETLVVVYHNITPAKYFEQWDQVTATGQIWARAQLTRLAQRTTLALPVSHFNQAELIEAGFGKTEVVPILLDKSSFAAGKNFRVDELLTKNRAANKTNFLFVGRLVPNKAQHKLIAALSAYNMIYQEDAILHLVGRPFAKQYLELLKTTAKQLRVETNVNFTMGVSSDELASYYRGSDAFISVSEHEGFCVPLLEAMHHGLPIVAYNSSAISETLGCSGILVEKNDPVSIAVAMRVVAKRKDARDHLTAAMKIRLEQLSLERSREKLFRALSDLEPTLLSEKLENA